MKYLFSLMLLVVSIPSLASADLIKTKNCLTCHAVDRKLVGPSFNDIAGRYSEKDIPYIAGVIQRGGSSRWGPIPMPGNASITPEEANSLARWVLEQR
jgi:cytochrome c